MKLFGENAINVIAEHGTAIYFPEFISANESKRLFDAFGKTIPWQHDVVKMYGKTIVTKRKVAWYGVPGLKYRYSGIDRYALPFFDELNVLRESASRFMNEDYNSCLLNYYHSGLEGMSWHSDDEKEMDRSSGIFSISLGDARLFSFKAKASGNTINVLLENGSALYMDFTCQQYWKHALPVTKKSRFPRINLTFRKINAGE
jgi:alkylated DNA repair dioxygenase AlkB